MEINQPKALGAGILVMSILEYIGAGFAIIGMAYSFLMKDALTSAMSSLPADQVAKVTAQLSTQNLIITIVIALALVLGVTLILLKKAVGVYIFFTCIVINIIYGIIINGFSVYTLIGLIFPALMAVFIYNKKEIFFEKPLQ
jgi:hypothetical protein